MSRRIHIEIGRIIVDGAGGRAAFEAALRREIGRQVAGAGAIATDRGIARIDGGTATRGGEAALIGGAIATAIGERGPR